MSIAKGVALITGSARGIGRGIALRLAKDGFDVALNDVPSKRELLRIVADDIEKIGRRTLLVPADVSVEREVKEMVQDACKELGGLDVMVANAGIGIFTSLVTTSLPDWKRVMAVNIRGPFLCYKYAAQQMIKQGRGGRIIGASSVAGKVGLPLGATYSASKFALRGLTQTAALELGKYNVTGNCYAPGAIETPLKGEVLDSGMFATADPDLLNSFMNFSNKSYIKHDGQPEDVANLVSFLASKEAHWITGQCISVDGGLTQS
ncbi:hypothetical protein V8E55_008272 [Tylopilus felleus]